MDEQNKSKGETSQAITAFEEILEVMPNDLFALEALHDAYLELGNTQNAYHYLKHLAELVKTEGDRETLTRVSDKLLFLSADHPEAQETANDLARQSENMETASNAKPDNSRGLKTEHDIQSSITQEISLAWDLYKDGRITKEDYSNITNDLTEMSSKEVTVPISVMHVLYDRSLGNTEKIVAYIATQSGTPLISLSNFELQSSATEKLPAPFLKKLGALPFDFVGEDLMVAILNPFNKELQDKVSERSEHQCHFFLVTAPDYDNALAKVLQNE